MTRHVRSFHVQGLRRASAPLLLSLCFGLGCETVWKCLEPCLQRVNGFLDSSRGVVVRNTSHCLACAENDFDVTSGGDCQTVVDIGVARALRSGRAVGIDGYETKEETPQTLLLMHSCFRLFASLFPPLFFFLMLFSQFLCCFFFF